MTPFDPWLRQLATAQLLVDDIPPAFRGLKWEQPIEIEGDYTNAALEGTVSVTPGAPALATFAMTGPTIGDGVDDDGNPIVVSTWIASLAAGTAANSTGALSADVDGDGIATFAAMFRLTPSGGNKDVLLGGAFTVLEQA